MAKAKFVVELDYMPSALTGRQLPFTRRTIIAADYIGAALEVVAEQYRPGNDCVAVRVLDFHGGEPGADE